MKILITGGSGSLGQALTRFLLDGDEQIESIRILSRNEHKQAEMAAAFGDDSRLRFFIGDVRDLGRVQKAIRDVDLVVHAAALKKVDSGEYNVGELVKTNVLGTANVIAAAVQESRQGGNLQRVMFVGTDKACDPVNSYGTSKLLAERLITSANYNNGALSPIFAAVRYGNVLNSAGSVVPLFKKWKAAGEDFRVTDINMTRFTITLEEAVEFVWDMIGRMCPGYSYVPRLKSYNLLDLIEAFGVERADTQIIGTRPGEKLDEVLISRHEIPRVIDRPGFFMIRPLIPVGGDDLHPSTALTAEYSSATAEKLTVGEIKELIEQQ